MNRLVGLWVALSCFAACKQPQSGQTQSAARAPDVGSFFVDLCTKPADLPKNLPSDLLDAFHRWSDKDDAGAYVLSDAQVAQAKLQFLELLGWKSEVPQNFALSITRSGLAGEDLVIRPNVARNVFAELRTAQDGTFAFFVPDSERSANPCGAPDQGNCSVQSFDTWDQVAAAALDAKYTQEQRNLFQALHELSQNTANPLRAASFTQTGATRGAQPALTIRNCYNADNVGVDMHGTGEAILQYQEERACFWDAKHADVVTVEEWKTQLGPECASP